MTCCNAAAANDIAVVQSFDNGVRLKLARQRVGFVAIEFRVETRTLAKRMRFLRQRGIEKNTEQRALDAGIVKSFQYPDRIAAPAAAGIVGNVRKQHDGFAELPPQASALCVASSIVVSRGM